MKRHLSRYVLLAFVCIFFSLALVLAVVPEEKEKNVRGDKNTTYGQCVKVGVEYKNSCFVQAKSMRQNCTSQVVDDTLAVKQCAREYKSQITECKTQFKSTKKACIQTTKPRFWERARYSFA